LSVSIRLQEELKLCKHSGLDRRPKKIFLIGGGGAEAFVLEVVIMEHLDYPASLPAPERL
jgi:hypothetical protein